MEKQQLVPVSSAGRWKFGGMKCMTKREGERERRGALEGGGAMCDCVTF